MEYEKELNKIIGELQDTNNDFDMEFLNRIQDAKETNLFESKDHKINCLIAFSQGVRSYQVDNGNHDTKWIDNFINVFKNWYQDTLFKMGVN